MERDEQRDSKIVTKCDVYQWNKNENVLTLGLLHPLHIPYQKYEEILMDFNKGLPMLDEKEKIFVVVDRLTRYTYFMAVKKIDSIKQTA